MINEIGNIFLYVAAFGFSDYIVNHYKLKDYKYLLYYLSILVIGILIIYKSKI